MINMVYTESCKIARIAYYFVCSFFTLISAHHHMQNKPGKGIFLASTYIDRVIYVSLSRLIGL